MVMSLVPTRGVNGVTVCLPQRRCVRVCVHVCDCLVCHTADVGVRARVSLCVTVTHWLVNNLCSHEGSGWTVCVCEYIEDLHWQTRAGSLYCEAIDVCGYSYLITSN